MTYSQLMETGVKMLADAGFEEARTDARALLFFVTGMDFMSFLRDGNSEISKDQEERFYSVLKDRIKHVPVQYIVGEQEFCGLHFFVEPGVLIPRPETELLAEAVFTQAAGKRVLDMCTGSGCIAVTVAKLGRPEFVAASDYSAEALAVAKKNAVRNEDSITFFQGELFENVDGRYDIIVSNPPYITSEDMEDLPKSVRDFEPHLALDGGADGLDIYRRIAAEASKYLNRGGNIYLRCEH